MQTAAILETIFKSNSNCPKSSSNQESKAGSVLYLALLGFGNLATFILCLQRQPRYLALATLKDGSKWRYSPDQHEEALTWERTALITVTQNSRWFSEYEYKIINLKTESFLEANVYCLPEEITKSTLFIKKIDKTAGSVSINNTSLEEPSTWELCNRELHHLENWDVEDIIYIGTNAEQKSQYPNLLINISLNDHINARKI